MLLALDVCFFFFKIFVDFRNDDTVLPVDGRNSANQLRSIKHIYPPETNIAPENRPSQKDISSSNHRVSGAKC